MGMVVVAEINQIETGLEMRRRLAQLFKIDPTQRTASKAPENPKLGAIRNIMPKIRGGTRI